MRENVQQLAGQEKADELNQIADDIESALKEAGNPKGALSDALQQLADEIREAAGSAEKGDNEGADEAASEAINEASESISGALAEQGNIGELMGQLEGIMGEAIEMLAQGEMSGMFASGEESGQSGSEGEGSEGEGSEGEGSEGEGSEGEGSEGEGSEGEGSEGEGSDGEGRGGRNEGRVRRGGSTGSEDDADFEPSMTENNSSKSIDRYVRDSEPVIDGNTPYLDVFDEYFEDAKQQMINGALPDELRSKVQRYFEIIQ